jgi:hypothetical protein
MAITQVQGLFVANNTIGGNNIIGSSITANKLAPALTITSNTNFTGANTVVGSAQLKISSANTVIQGAHNNIVSANTVFSGHVLFEGTLKNVGTTVGIVDPNTVAFDTQNTFTKAQVPSTSTATLASTSGVLDFDTHQNFILTLASGSNTLAAPTTEASQIGQTGTIIFIQPSSGAKGTLSIHGDYETVGSSGLSLSVGNNDYDVVPYIIKADNSILLGAPQKNFG